MVLYGGGGMNVRVDERAVRVDGRVNGRACVQACVHVWTRTGVRAHIRLRAQLYTYRNNQVQIPGYQVKYLAIRYKYLAISVRV